MKPVIFWFRRDLRLYDQPLLHEIAKEKRPLLAIYIIEDGMGAAQRAYLMRSLKFLEEDLWEYKIHLWILNGKASDLIQKVISQTHATHLYFNRVAEPFALKEEQEVEKMCRRENIELKIGKANLFFQPSERCYKVFTPFWRAMRPLISESPLLSKPLLRPFPTKKEHIMFESEEKWAADMLKPWPIGEKKAKKKLDYFCKNILNGYDISRDFPAEEGTSRLSVHIHFGELSVERIFSKIMNDDAKSHDKERFLAELGWREFAHQLLLHHPHMDKKSLKEEFDKIKWKQNKKLFSLWKEGKTGYPIVDAGMRELWQTGYMHNRVRMVAASFLVKHLLIDWREGEKWFWQTLVDADLANNSASWQWVAGCGADAVPYFRIFNPTLQAQKFDPKGDYVRKWIPEIGTDNYPEPVVDHAASRKLALEMYQRYLKG